MHAKIIQLGTNGVALRKGTRGRGFTLIPAVAFDAAITARLGNFPVRVTPVFGATKGEPLEVVSSRSLFFAEEFTSLNIEGGESGDSFLLEVYETKEEGGFGGQPVSNVRQVQAATAVPTAAPSLTTDGFRLRSGTQGHNFVFSGTARSVTIWQLTRGGTWAAATDDVIDTSAEPVAYREVKLGAQGLYLQASGAGALVEIDAVERVG